MNAPNRAAAADIAALARFDTPTICNALELLSPRARLAGYTRRMLVKAPDAYALSDERKAIVGRAKTARIAAAFPHGRTDAENAENRASYYEYIADSAAPSIVIIEDIDPEPVGAFWGEVNSHLHRGLGAIGAVTNGTIRDLDDLDPDFLLLAGAVKPSHAHVHILEFGEGASVFGMTVADGDIIHADKHGAVVIPEDAVGKLAATIAAIAEREARILALAKSPPVDLDALRAALGAPSR